MAVKIHIHPNMTHLTDSHQILKVTAGTVSESIHQIISQYPNLGKFIFDNDGNLKPFIEIYVNRMALLHKDINIKIDGNDEIHLMLTIAGG